MRASPVAALRIYEPLAAFPLDERPGWERYARSGFAASRAESTRREREITMAAAVRRRLDPVPSGAATSSGSTPEHGQEHGQADIGPGGAGTGADQALTQRVDGLLYVCPWRLQLRIWLAAQEFRAGLPRLLADAFIPAAAAAQAESALEHRRLHGAELKVPVRCSSWTIPVPWLYVFDPAERTLMIGRGPAGERSLLYATAMAQARRRVARALSVLRRTLPDALSIAGLEDVGRWLEEFHPHSLVELDYGGLVTLLSDAELRAETSVADIAEALAGLADGEHDNAKDVYARLMRRLRRLQAVEQAS